MFQICMQSLRTGTKLSISALPILTDDSCKVPLGLKLNRTGTGTIIIQDPDIDESSYRQ